METLGNTPQEINDEMETLRWAVEPVESEQNYRDLPIQAAFNWRKLLREVTEYLGHDQEEYYLVVFRSDRDESKELAELITRLDAAAFQEAKASKALIHYFAGEVEDGRAISWCLWTNAEDALQALHGSAHTEAAQTAYRLKEQYRFSVEGYALRPQLDDEPDFELLFMHRSEEAA